jgi:hypothetical protein
MNSSNVSLKLRTGVCVLLIGGLSSCGTTPCKSQARLVIPEELFQVPEPLPLPTKNSSKTITKTEPAGASAAKK